MLFVLRFSVAYYALKGIITKTSLRSSESFSLLTLQLTLSIIVTF